MMSKQYFKYKSSRRLLVATQLIVTLYCCFLALASHLTLAQDILRQTRTNQQTNQVSNPLANIQLPPQLASLTPQQLHQLAQLRELQLQQQAAQQQDNNVNSAPAPIGIEALTATTTNNNNNQPAPTSQPSSTSGSQIPQPNSAASNENNDRHDDGSYNESGSEMEGVMQPSSSSSQEANGNSQQTGNGAPSSSSSSTASAPTFEVNWNKCPQLEPSESEKNKKTQVITKCLQSAPIPTNLTRENVEAHREQIATCALRVEGWFDDNGNYKYDKAESEIRGKKLEPTIEIQVLKFHVACKDESSKKFPRDQNKLIDQVQFYQACMDYYISIVCEIEVSVDQ